MKNGLRFISKRFAMGFRHVASVIFLKLESTEAPRVVFSQSVVSSIRAQSQPLSPSHPSRPVLPLDLWCVASPSSSHEPGSKRAALVSFSSHSPDTAPCGWLCLPTSCHTLGTSRLHRLPAPDICPMASGPPLASILFRIASYLSTNAGEIVSLLSLSLWLLRPGPLQRFSHPKERNALQAE